MEGGKPENLEKNPQSTGDTNYMSSDPSLRKKPGAIPKVVTHPAITPIDRA